MDESNNVKITQWPKQKALLEHHFDPDTSCPVSIIFEDKPAHVEVSTAPNKPLDVDMKMDLSARNDIPLCIKICEPICATSNYQVDLNLLGQPLLQIAVKGVTRLGPCEEDPQLEPATCVNFDDSKHNQSRSSPYTRGDVEFSAIQDEILRWQAFLPPPVTTQLVSPNSGLSIRFPEAVQQVEMKVVNYGNPVIQVSAYLDGGQVFNASPVIENAEGSISVPPVLNQIELQGGSNELGIIELCFRSAK